MERHELRDYTVLQGIWVLKIMLWLPKLDKALHGIQIFFEFMKLRFRPSGFGVKARTVKGGKESS